MPFFFLFLLSWTKCLNYKHLNIEQKKKKKYGIFVLSTTCHNEHEQYKLHIRKLIQLRIVSCLVPTRLGFILEYSNARDFLKPMYIVQVNRYLTSEFEYFQCDIYLKVMQILYDYCYLLELNIVIIVQIFYQIFHIRFFFHKNF